MSTGHVGATRLRRAATIASVLAVVCATFVAAPAQGSDVIVQTAAVSARQALPVKSSVSVTPAPSLAAKPASVSPSPRGDIVYRPGVPVRNVSVSRSGAVVRATVFWNQQMIARKGHRDRFNVRLAAFGPAGAASTIVLKNRSTTQRPPGIQRVTLKLSKKKAKQLRTSSDVALAVSQQYGRAGAHHDRYFRQYVTVKKLKARSAARTSARGGTTVAVRAGRSCATIEIKPGADLSDCDLSRANLSVCDLAGVNLSGAILSGAVLTSCDLNNAELAGADLNGVVSGGITGTPASLPDDWALINGVLTSTGPRPPPEMFAVTYAAGGADSGTVPVDGSSPYVAGVTVTVLANTGSLVKAGNTFGGWSDGVTTYQPADTFTMPSSVVTLTAVWTPVPTFAVTYAAGGADSGTVPVDGSSPYVAGVTVTVLANTGSLVKAGNTFGGWSDGAMTYQPADTFTMPSSVVTLTAVWTPVPTFAVTYAAGGADSGTVPVDGSSPYVAGATVTVLANMGSLVKAGNTFGGWSDGATTYQPADTFTMPSSAVTLTAVWTPPCDTGGGAAGTCEVGDTGPGGGTVFYVDEGAATGSRYMEVAPNTWSGGTEDPSLAWCSDTTNSVTTGTAIGTGAANTTAMLTSTGSFVACTAGAANSVRAYGTVGAPIGSWSLPSQDEAKQLCRWSWNQETGPSQTGDCSGEWSAPPTGGFVDGAYWSSSQDISAANAWIQDFGLGNQNGSGKGNSFRVRPVRAF